MAIQQQDKTVLSTLPGIGEATAERVIAKLRRKVAKFALMVERTGPTDRVEMEPDVVADAFAALQSVGHSDQEARQLIDQVIGTRKKKYKSAADLLEEVYRVAGEGNH